MGRFITQTEMADHFLVSSILFGKKLIDLDLKDVKTKLATQKALTEDLAKNISKKDQTFSIWNKSIISKIEKNITKDLTFCANIIVGCFLRFKEIQKESDGTKIYDLYVDSLFMDLDRFFIFFSKDEETKNKIHEKTLKLAKKKGVLDDYLNWISTYNDNI